MWAPVTAIHSIRMLIFHNHAALKIPDDTAIKQQIKYDKLTALGQYI